MMRISGHWLVQQIAVCLALVLMAAPFAASSPQQEKNHSQPEQQTVSSAETQLSAPASDKDSETPVVQPETLPNSPGSVRSLAADSRVAAQQPSPEEQPQSGTQEPVGTAAAPFVKTTGVAASQPAGAAIAPAKQRRARSILIKVGLIAGAAVAVGTVAALSSASPSHPSH